MTLGLSDCIIVYHLEARSKPAEGTDDVIT